MHIVHFSAEQASPITPYDSRSASAQRLGTGHGRCHVYAIHIEADGIIDFHPAGFGQLFLAIAGSGWVAGADRQRHAIKAGEGAVIARGEVHAKGSDTGLTAVMIQIEELADE